MGNRGQNLFYQNKFCCRRRPKIIKILGQLRHVPLFPAFCLLLFLIKWCGLSKAIHTPGGNQLQLQHPSHPFIKLGAARGKGWFFLGGIQTGAADGGWLCGVLMWFFWWIFFNCIGEPSARIRLQGAFEYNLFRGYTWPVCKTCMIGNYIDIIYSVAMQQPRTSKRELQET